MDLGLALALRDLLTPFDFFFAVGLGLFAAAFFGFALEPTPFDFFAAFFAATPFFFTGRFLVPSMGLRNLPV